MLLIHLPEDRRVIEGRHIAQSCSEAHRLRRPGRASAPPRDPDARAAPGGQCSKATAQFVFAGSEARPSGIRKQKAPPKRGFSQQTEEGVTGERGSLCSESARICN